MFRNQLMVSALSVVCLVSSAAVVPVASASVFGGNSTANHLPSTKTVNLSVRNDSKEALSVTIGEQSMTIEAGKTVKVKAPVGAKIVNVNETKTHKAGEVLSEVSKELSDATLHVS